MPACERVALYVVAMFGIPWKREAAPGQGAAISGSVRGRVAGCNDRCVILRVVAGLHHAEDLARRDAELVLVVKQFLDPGKSAFAVVLPVGAHHRLAAEEYVAAHG